MELIENVLEIDFDNAYFGLSYINTSDTVKTLYLCGLIVDKSNAIETETHGAMEPLYLYPDTEEFVWSWSLDSNESIALQPYQYLKLEADQKDYYAGVSKGFYDQIEYPQANVDTRQWTINVDEDVDITFWVIELDKNTSFDVKNIVCK